MKVTSTIKELQRWIGKKPPAPVGFIPTMGALHYGHLSLANLGIAQCPCVVVSIFVNPTQFNDKEDLINYPRTIEKDLQLLSTILRENDIVFNPDTKEIYPEEDKRIFNFRNLDKVMEGKHRPGHFTGVAQIVTKLFDIIKPDFAYFGQKDFQQLTIIKELVRQSGCKIKIIPCPIVRESDGLAMSSRNKLLDPEIRKNAGIIYKTLSLAVSMLREYDVKQITDFVTRSIDSINGFTTEYFEIVDEKELIPLLSKKEIKEGIKYFGCIAVRAGKIRLIDNIEFGLV